jgi:Family of unknown function (DUF6221)
VSALVEFLNARLDEDEQLARLACAGESGAPPDVLADGQTPIPWRADHGNVWAEGRHSVATARGNGVAMHIARHDPARVLREVEATRELVRLAERAHDYHETFMNGFGAAMEQVLRLYAAAHSDHPDYREEWRP